MSPDPIGPVSQRAESWQAFREFADEHGWSVAVMGVGSDWLPVYAASGMHDLYIGDEAVVDVRRFSLDGKQNKSLRQSVGRVEKAGYRVEFFDPARLERDLEAQAAGVDDREPPRRRRARVLDDARPRVRPRRPGLLLAVAFDADDAPAGFCQYVPARAIGGWSLDLMRRSESTDVPNGLTEFVVAKTIEHLRAQGYDRTGAELRDVPGRARQRSRRPPDAPCAEVVPRARMGDSMQIESLWTFNEKFQPEWHPRYAVYDSPEHMLTASIAVARAESFFELPLIGRFFAGRRRAQVDEPPSRAPRTRQGCDGLGPSPPTSNARSST